MSGSDFFGMLSIFFLFGMLGLALVLVWIFGEDPAKRNERENKHDASR